MSSYCLLSIYNVQGAILGTGEVAVNKTNKNLCPLGVYIPVGETDSKQHK